MSMKIWYYNYRASSYVRCKFQAQIFQKTWEIGRQRASWPGRAGTSRISILHRKIITFCSMNHIDKIKISRVMMLFRFPMWLYQEVLCVDQRDASRRVSLLLSLKTLVFFTFNGGIFYILHRWICNALEIIANISHGM